jgi:hypothetical protein
MKAFYSKPVLRLGFFPSAAVLPARFIGWNGNQLAVLGAAAAGISVDEVTPTEITEITSTWKPSLSAGIIGVEVLEAGAAINAEGLELTSDASGRGIVAVAGNKVNAISCATADAAGEKIAALIVREPYTKA